MEQGEDKIRLMEGYRKKPEDAGPADGKPEGQEAPRRDLATPALVLSLLSLVLMAVFFFGMSSNLKGISDEVRQVSALRSDLAALQAGLEEVRSRPTDGARKAVLQSLLEDMVQKSTFIEVQLQDTAQSARLSQVRELLRQVQTDIGQ